MKGSTLIETLVYISLLSVLMIGVFSSVYIIISYESRQASDNIDNYELLLRKII